MQHQITPLVWFSVVLLAIPAAAQVAPLPGPTANAITLSFGVIGLASGESIRINVLNLVRTPPPLGIAQIPCRTELSFYDADGKLLKQKVVDSLGFGRADFLDLDRAEITGSTGRAQIAASVKMGSNQSFFCSIAPTIEVFDDATGRASTVLTNPLPQPVIVPRFLAAQ
jgi:hypothetical protein